MFRLVVLFVTYLTVAVAAEELECMRFGVESLGRCCKKHLRLTPRKPTPEQIKVMKDLNEECHFKIRDAPPSCELDICIGKKLGYGSDDGTFDKTALAEVLKDEEADESLYEKEKANCIDGDLSRYGPPEHCDLLKFRFCLDAHILLDCQEWSEEDDCKGIDDLVKRCT